MTYLTDVGLRWWPRISRHGTTCLMLFEREINSMAASAATLGEKQAFEVIQAAKFRSQHLERSLAVPPLPACPA